MFEGKWREEDHGYVTRCYVWQGALNRDGYAIVYHKGRSRLVHTLVKPGPFGMQADHLCRVRACIRKDHLEIVTPAQNARRRSSTKLTEEDVAAIRQMIADGVWSYTYIGRKFGITRGQVCNIHKGRNWN